MAFGVYSPKRVLLTFDEIGITGFAEGTFVKVMQTKDSFSVAPDADGGGCMVLEGDESGSIEFTLHQSSPSNAFLMSKANQQRQTLTPGTAVVRDLNGTFLGQCVGMLAKPADTERSNQTSNAVWKVVSLKVEQEGGGVTPV